MNDYRRRVERYRARIAHHLRKFFEHIDENDLVQAAEKAWGLVSAFANIYAIVFHGEEVKRDRKKKEMLVEFLNSVAEHDVEIGELVMREYRGHVETLVASLVNLHSFFYGGTGISDEDVERYLKHSRRLLPILYEYANILAEYYLGSYEE